MTPNIQPAVADVGGKARFVYFSHSTLQVPRVARQCMVALCEAAAELGAQSHIVSITMRANAAEALHPPFPELYGVDTPIQFQNYRLPGMRVDGEANYVAVLRLMAYFWHMIKPDTFCRLRAAPLVVLSARNASVLALLVCLKRLLYRRIVVLADVHGEPTTGLARWVHRQVDGNVCISRHLAEVLRHRCSLSDIQVWAAHTGVKPERFQRTAEKEEIAQRLKLDRTRPIICYAGKVHYRYEEVAYLLEVARQLRDEGTLVIVGGRPDQIPPWEEECRRRGIRNVVFTGFKLPAEVPAYLQAADLLVMYYSPSALNDYRSPGKLFEYLASGTPLVASRFRGIEEIIKDGQNGFLVEPYRPDLLATRIRDLLHDRSKWDEVSRQAIATAQRFTWKARAAAFLEYAEYLHGLSSSQQDRKNPKKPCTAKAGAVVPDAN